MKIISLILMLFIYSSAFAQDKKVTISTVSTVYENCEITMATDRLVSIKSNDNKFYTFKYYQLSEESLKIVSSHEAVIFEQNELYWFNHFSEIESILSWTSELKQITKEDVNRNIKIVNLLIAKYPTKFNYLSQYLKSLQ